MKKFVSILITALLVMALVVPAAISAPATVSAHTESNPLIQILYAGQNTDVGTVSVWNDTVNLYVKYDTTGEWKMTETHLAVADSLPDIPQTKIGNPIPGQFPYSTKHDPAVTEWTYEIPLSEIGENGVHCDDKLVIAAHAKVVSPIEGCYETVWGAVVSPPIEGCYETAWGAGTPFPGKNWATYFNYTVQGWQWLETITVPAIGTKMTSDSSLVNSHLYKFEASGTCNWRIEGSSSGYLGDAEYWLRHDAYGEGWTHMGIWSLAMYNVTPIEVEWGLYNEFHVYTFMYTAPADGQVTFFFNDDGYRDNSGSLQVIIYEWK